MVELKVINSNLNQQELQRLIGVEATITSVKVETLEVRTVEPTTLVAIFMGSIAIIGPIIRSILEQRNCKKRSELRSPFPLSLTLKIFVGNIEEFTLYEYEVFSGEDDINTEMNQNIPGILQTIDVFARYEAGLGLLLSQLKGSSYNEALIYEQRLRENIENTRRYGDNPQQKSERAEIIEHLNSLTTVALEMSFNELCWGAREQSFRVELEVN